MADVDRGTVHLSTAHDVKDAGQRAPHLPRLHPALIVVVGACAALFHEAMRTGLLGDVFYQLSAGQWMLAHHAVIRRDVFSSRLTVGRGSRKSGASRYY